MSDATSASPFGDPLPELAAALERRYPGVTVDAFLATAADNQRSQVVRFFAPRAVLVDHGLVQPDGSFRDYVDQYGTQVLTGRDYVIHLHAEHSGALRGRVSSQHAENAATRKCVETILKRIGGAHV